MRRHVLHEVLRCLVLVVAVSFVTFALVSASPIDPVQANLGQTAYLSLTEAERARLEAAWGLDQPFLVRFATWFAGLLRGDMGESIRFQAPVAAVIAERAGASFALMATAWVLSGALGLVLGIVAGMQRDRLSDRAIRTCCFVLTSVPAFWLALVLLIVFAVWLGWFPIGFAAPVGAAAESVSWGERLYHLVLPALTLSLAGMASIALHTREKTIEVMEQPHIRYACAQGTSRWQALWHHGLRSLLLPAITLQFASIGEVFGGSILVEQVFSYPGLGQAAVTAGLGGDAALLAGIAVVSSVVVFAGNLVASILYGVVEPRIAHGNAQTRRPMRGGDAHGQLAR